jgi:anti-anti-sigma factor
VSFSVESRQIDKAIVRICVFGGLDAAAEHKLRQAIHDALAVHGLKGIIVDLDGVAVVDDAGIRAIEHSHRVADRADVPLLVVNAHNSRTRSILDSVGILTATSRT